MSAVRTIAIRLKIPDNEAYTALTALRRLGVDLGRLERAEIWELHDDGSVDDFVARVERNETLFNPNKHELEVLASRHPRDGEVWIAQLDARDVALRVARAARGRRYVGWRLFAHGHDPAARETVESAAERLLCNPAIERAIFE